MRPAPSRPLLCHFWTAPRAWHHSRANGRLDQPSKLIEQTPFSNSINAHPRPHLGHSEPGAVLSIAVCPDDPAAQSCRPSSIAPYILPVHPTSVHKPDSCCPIILSCSAVPACNVVLSRCCTSASAVKGGIDESVYTTARYWPFAVSLSRYSIPTPTQTQPQTQTRTRYTQLP